MKSKRTCTARVTKVTTHWRRGRDFETDQRDGGTIRKHRASMRKATKTGLNTRSTWIIFWPRTASRMQRIKSRVSGCYWARCTSYSGAWSHQGSRETSLMRTWSSSCRTTTIQNRPRLFSATSSTHWCGSHDCLLPSTWQNCVRKGKRVDSWRHAGNRDSRSPGVWD